MSDGVDGEIPLEDELEELPKPQPGKRSWPRPWQAGFLSALSVLPDVTAACGHAGISRQTAYKWRRRDDVQGHEFAAAWDEAVELAVDYLQTRAWESATRGVQEKVVRETVKKDAGGAVVETTTVTTTRTVRDGTMAIFMLKAWRPDRYRWREQVGVSDPNGDPVQYAQVDAIDQRIAELSAELAARAGGAPPPTE